MSKQKKDKPRDPEAVSGGGDLSPIDPEFVAIAKNRELHKTIRTLGIGCWIVVGLGIVAWVIIAVFTTDPPWVKLVSILAAIVAAAAAVGAPTMFMIYRFRFYMKRDHDRTIKIEAKVDAGRLSSGINKDGTSEFDG